MENRIYRGAKRKYTSQQIKEVLELRKEGFALAEIEEITSIPKGTIGSIVTGRGNYGEVVKDFGVSVKPRKPRTKEVARSADPVKAMLLLYCQGKSTQDISIILNMDVMIVDTIINDAKKLGKITQTWQITE